MKDYEKARFWEDVLSLVAAAISTVVVGLMFSPPTWASVMFCYLTYQTLRARDMAKEAVKLLRAKEGE